MFPPPISPMEGHSPPLSCSPHGCPPGWRNCIQQTATCLTPHLSSQGLPHHADARLRTGKTPGRVAPPPPPPPGLSHREEGRLGWPPWGEVCPCLGCRRATVAPAAWLVSASSAAPRWCGGPRQGLHQLQSMTSDTGAALAGHLLHSAVLLPCTANCCSNCWLRPAGDLRWSCRWKLGHFGAGQTEASDTWLTTDWMSVGGQAESKSMLRGGRASLS